MNDLVYAGVVCAGAVTLLIEAYRNFNSSLSSVPFREHPILQNVEVEKLCTRRERNIGFIFYSLLYLVTYAIVLSSATVMNLLVNASEKNSQIGPRDDLLTIDNDPFFLGSSDYGTPIFVSAAIIAIFSLGALRPVESTMRSLSHRLAGVPRGVYEAIERLHEIDFTDIPEAGARSFSLKFEENFADAFKAGPLQHQIPTLTNELLAIDYLSPAIVGGRRLRFFPFTQLETMHELSLKMQERLDALQNLLENSGTDEESLGKLATQISATFNDAVALFAVNFLRNNRALKGVKPIHADDSPTEPLSHVFEALRRDYRVEMNSLVMAALFSLVLGVAWTSWELAQWTEAASPVTDAMFIADVRASIDAETEKLSKSTVLTAQQIEVAQKNISSCTAFPGGNNPAFRSLVLPDSTTERTQLLLSAQDRSLRDWLFQWFRTTDSKWNDYPEQLGEYGQTCFQFWMSPAKKQIAADRQIFFFEALKSILPIMMAVVCAAIVTVFARDVRRDDNSWPNWSLRRPPFLRLMSFSVLPAVTAVFMVAVGSIAIVWFDAGFRPSEQVLTNHLRASQNYFLMYAGMGFIIAIGVLFLTDNHRDLFNEQTFLIGVGFAAVVFFWSVLTVIIGYPPAFVRPSPYGIDYSHEMRETRITAVQPVLFLLFYAMFLEFTEPDKDDTGWWFSRLWKWHGQRSLQQENT